MCSWVWPRGAGGDGGLGECLGLGVPREWGRGSQGCVCEPAPRPPPPLPGDGPWAMLGTPCLGMGTQQLAAPWARLGMAVPINGPLSSSSSAQGPGLGSVLQF